MTFEGCVLIVSVFCSSIDFLMCVSSVTVVFAAGFSLDWLDRERTES